MSKHIEKLKKQLIEISEVVNSFKSEAVQVKIIDRLFDAMNENDNGDGYDPNKKARKHHGEHDSDDRQYQGKKKPGATKVLNQILLTDFFNTPRAISEIADHCRENYDSYFKTSELSGILLKLAKENKLKRERNDINNRFDYVRAGK